MANVGLYPKEVRPLAGSITKTFEAGEAEIQIPMLLRITADGKVVRARANSAANATGKLCIAVAAAGVLPNASGSVPNGGTLTVVLKGAVFMGKDAALDETKPYFLSNDLGRIADAAGTVKRAVGYPLSSQILFFDDTDIEPSSS